LESTILRPDAGRTVVGDLPLERYLALPAGEKPFRIAMVFQGAALLGSLRVGENVGLRLREHHQRRRRTCTSYSSRSSSATWTPLTGADRHAHRSLPHGARGDPTHNLGLASAIADRVAFLDGGCIIGCMPPAELTASTHPLIREFLRAAGLGR
jgi:ABC-type transporter Mla maintaining outer membrane lipid asymmetry ATPase subunit MlaF